MGETYFIICATCQDVYVCDKDELLYEINQHVGHKFVVVDWSDFNDLDLTVSTLKRIVRLLEGGK